MPQARAGVGVESRGAGLPHRHVIKYFSLCSVYVQCEVFAILTHRSLPRHTHFLAMNRKKLNDEQLSLLVAKVGAGKCLYIRVACEELMVQGQYGDGTFSCHGVHLISFLTLNKSATLSPSMSSMSHTFIHPYMHRCIDASCRYVPQ